MIKANKSYSKTIIQINNVIYNIITTQNIVEMRLLHYFINLTIQKNINKNLKLSVGSERIVTALNHNITNVQTNTVCLLVYLVLPLRG